MLITETPTDARQQEHGLELGGGIFFGQDNIWGKYNYWEDRADKKKWQKAQAKGIQEWACRKHGSMSTATESEDT